MNTKEWLDEVSKGALCSRTTLHATYNSAMCLILDDVPGDFVECGVWAGANSAAMARAVQDFAVLNAARKMDAREIGGGVQGLIGPPLSDVRRRVHLFDSFQGIPQAGEYDIEYLAAGHKAGLSASSLENTKHFM